MVKESTIQKNILKYLNSIPGAFAVNVHGGPYGNAGEPDINATIDGKTVRVEVKRPGKLPTKIQMAVMEKWRKAGAVVFVAASVDDVKTELRKNGFDQVN